MVVCGGFIVQLNRNDSSPMETMTRRQPSPKHHLTERLMAAAHIAWGDHSFGTLLCNFFGGGVAVAVGGGDGDGGAMGIPLQLGPGRHRHPLGPALRVPSALQLEERKARVSKLAESVSDFPWARVRRVKGAC